MNSPESTVSEWPRVQVSGLDFDALTEDEVVEVDTEEMGCRPGRVDNYGQCRYCSGRLSRLPPR